MLWVAHLGPGGQQQLHALRLALQAGRVQGRDGVHHDLVDAGPTLDQLLQLPGLPPLGCLVHGGALHPETWKETHAVLRARHFCPGQMNPRTLYETQAIVYTMV